MVLGESLIRLLVDDRTHVTAWVVIGDHVEVLKGLECVVKLSDESMIDFALNFFFGDDESRQTVISTLFHALHCVENPGAFPFFAESLN